MRFPESTLVLLAPFMADPKLYTAGAEEIEAWLSADAGSHGP